MKRNWILSYAIMGSLAFGGLSYAQEASKNEDKKEDKKEEKTAEIKVKAGKIILVGPDGKIIEKSFEDGKVGEGKEITVEVTAGKDGEGKQIFLVTPKGEKKTVVMSKVDVKSDVKEVDGKKIIRLEAKVDGEGESKTIVISGDGKTFDVKGVGIDVEKIKGLIAEKKGEIKADEIMAIIKDVEGKPLGGAMKLHLQKVEGKPHVVVSGTSASASSGGDLVGKLDKILDRLEKLEERLAKLEKKD
jgi:hypothetical protein